MLLKVSINIRASPTPNLCTIVQPYGKSTIWRIIWTPGCVSLFRSGSEQKPLQSITVSVLQPSYCDVEMECRTIVRRALRRFFTSVSRSSLGLVLASTSRNNELSIQHGILRSNLKLRIGILYPNFRHPFRCLWGGGSDQTPVLNRIRWFRREPNNTTP